MTPDVVWTIEFVIGAMFSFGSCLDALYDLYVDRVSPRSTRATRIIAVFDLGEGVMIWLMALAGLWLGLVALRNDQGPDEARWSVGVIAAVVVGLVVCLVPVLQTVKRWMLRADWYARREPRIDGRTVAPQLRPLEDHSGGV